MQTEKLEIFLREELKNKRTQRTVRTGHSLLPLILRFSPDTDLEVHTIQMYFMFLKYVEITFRICSVAS